MKYILPILTLSFLLLSCNDGDIITESLEFEDTFKVCGDIESTEKLVIYKTKTSPNESLSLELNSLSLSNLFQTIVDPDNELLVILETETEIEMINNSNKFNYRTYDANPQSVFCNAVPSSDINIAQDYLANGGNATFTVKLIEDDNDGIPAEFEDINGDGDLDNDDTDSDGLPNYLDDDDDGDNVKTVSEQPNYNETDGLTLALNTDGDMLPNYLDPDDDGDGTPTIQEVSAVDDLNPTDDISDNTIGADYLNDMETSAIEVMTYATHSIKQTFELQLNITNLSLPVLTQEELFFGFLENATDVNEFIREVTPTF